MSFFMLREMRWFSAYLQDQCLDLAALQFSLG